MAALIVKTWQGYKWLFEEVTDPRTRTWFLVAKPHQGAAILCLYLMFVLKWGPKWMKNRPAFNLDKILIVYNVLQVMACMYIFYGAVWHAWGWNYKWVCEPVDYSNSESAMNVANFVFYYYMLKIVDLLDTVFFILRKKFNQVSFLHVYHHTGMVMLIWGAATYFPGGHGTLIGVINSFVHIVMYLYYLFTVAKPSLKRSFWWKKYITQLQILQFFWCVVHMSLLVFKTDCEYPRWIAAVFLPQNFFMLILFIDFYIKAYIRKPKQEDAKNVNKRKLNGYTEDELKNTCNQNGVSIDNKEDIQQNGSLRENSTNCKQKAH